MLIKLRKAQATAEYAILFAVVIGAAMGVQSYVKRAIQARIYDAANELTLGTGGTTAQWEGVTGTKSTTNQVSTRAFTENSDADAAFKYNETMKANYTSNTVR